MVTPYGVIRGKNQVNRCFDRIIRKYIKKSNVKS